MGVTNVAGPAKTPVIINEIKGNPGKRKKKTTVPTNKNIPYLVTPDHLSKTGKYWFKKLVDDFNQIGLIEQLDRLALELLVESYAEYRSHCKVVDEEGATYKTTATSGEIVIKANPAVAMKSDAWKRLKSMMEQFGMTPSARSKLDINFQEDVDPLEDFLSRRD